MSLSDFFARQSTVMSVSKTFCSLLAWAFVPKYACDDEGPCLKEDNMGWRYLCLTLGAMTFTMFVCRFFLFHLFESPKFLLSKGRQEEAVVAVHALAHHNKKKTWLTVDILNEIGGHPEEVADLKLSTTDIIKRQLSKFSGDRIGPLFAERKLAITSMSITLLSLLNQLVNLLNSRSPLVLLGHYWYGISSFQRFPPSIHCKLRW